MSAVTACVALRVANIRSRLRGGVLFSGHPLDEGGHQDYRSYVVVKATGKEYAELQVGELWEVSGERGLQSVTINGRRLEEPLITATELRLLKPSGTQVIRWMADHRDIHGIGTVKAETLWNALGEDLYVALDAGDAAPITAVLGNAAIATNLIEVWGRDGDTKTLRWMQAHQIPLDLARKIVRCHAAQSLAAMQENPYRLLAFSASWSLVDGIARAKLGIEEDDPRRLRAAVAQSVYEQMATGHTLADAKTLRPTLVRLLGARERADEALRTGLNSRAVVAVDGQFQAAGTYIMESTVAQFVRRLIAQPIQHDLLTGDVDAVLDAFEQDEASVKGLSEFRLNAAQRAAVTRSFASGFSIITGGAGVGKTTVLKALYRLFDRAGLRRFQMALSGRAAKRMRDATGEKAYTIAGFLRSMSTDELGESPVVIVDEASMVDLATMYRLTRKLPERCRMVLVGDPYQLPPIGAGLVLHCLVEQAAVPTFVLTVVKRQSAASGIPAFADAIRNGIWPDDLSADPQSPVAVIPCHRNEIMNRVLSLYEADRERTQILAAVRSNPFAGFKPINDACRHRYTASQGARELLVHDDHTDFYLGDLVLYTRNDWTRDLQNGLLGRLVEIYDEPRPVDDEAGGEVAIGMVDWEGRQVPLRADDLDWIEHGYAISIHKAQGSQFPRVIVPILPGRLLDRTLIYTACTRAQSQVILVGDVHAMRKAVEDAPPAHLRRVALPRFLAA